MVPIKMEPVSVEKVIQSLQLGECSAVKDKIIVVERMLAYAEVFQLYSVLLIVCSRVHL